MRGLGSRKWSRPGRVGAVCAKFQNLHFQDFSCDLALEAISFRQ